MTSGDEIPDSHHATRYCSFTRLREDGTPSSTAFVPDFGEDYVSVFWLEYAGLSDSRARIEDIRKRMTRSGITLKSKGKIANLGVGRTKEVVLSAFGKALYFRHKPSLDDGTFVDDAHAGIFGLSHDDFPIAELIAENVVELHPAK